MAKKRMTQAAARRIQSSQDTKGSKGNSGSKARAMKAVANNSKKK